MMKGKEKLKEVKEEKERLVERPKMRRKACNRRKGMMNGKEKYEKEKK